MKKLIPALLLFAVFLAEADPDDFSTGPVFEGYGENAVIDNGLASPAQQKFKVAFDVYEKNDGDGVLKGFNSVARFINMHVRAGVPLENIEVAIVVHGEAVFDLMNEGAHSKKFEKSNGSAELLTMMMEKGAKVYVCGQSASYQGVSSGDLLKGVNMSLSAMTTHALLQQQRFTLNPF